ncbi:MAG: acyl-CoA dehydrogenase [Chloroflexota bacterium]|nr:MAG: acyl-CoA dehydrogenase [Chloroflexota bacterium]
MDFSIPEDLKAVKNLARDLARNVLIPLEPEVNRLGKAPDSAMDKLKELGFFGVVIPEQYGGMGLGVLALTLITEELAHAHHAYLHEMALANGIGSHSLLLDGSEEQRRRYLPDIASGRKIAAFALTEPNAGSDPSSAETYAVKQGNEWVINGNKHFITNGADADIVTVIAVTDKEKRSRGGFTAFIVEKGTPGLGVAQIQESMGRPPHCQAEIYFQDCRVPEANIVGTLGNGFSVAMRTLDMGRVNVAAKALGIADRLLQMSIDYAKQRVQFKQPIASFQAIQWMIADMVTELHAARWITYNAAWRLDQGEKIPQESAIVKLFATEMVGRVADRAVQIHGGMGVMQELAVEGFYRDVRVMRIYEGTSEIQRLVIARDELK